MHCDKCLHLCNPLLNKAVEHLHHRKFQKVPGGSSCRPSVPTTAVLYRSVLPALQLHIRQIIQYVLF